MDDVVSQLKHLDDLQKADIKLVLSEITKLFDGTLGVYPHRKFHVELEPGAKPKHAQPYPIPVIHLEAFKKELMGPTCIRTPKSLRHGPNTAIDFRLTVLMPFCNEWSLCI